MSKNRKAAAENHDERPRSSLLDGHLECFFFENETSGIRPGKPKRTAHFSGHPDFTAARRFASEKGWQRKAPHTLSAIRDGSCVSRSITQIVSEQDRTGCHAW